MFRFTPYSSWGVCWYGWILLIFHHQSTNWCWMAFFGFVTREHYLWIPSTRSNTHSYLYVYFQCLFMMLKLLLFDYLNYISGKQGRKGKMLILMLKVHAEFIKCRCWCAKDFLSKRISLILKKSHYNFLRSHLSLVWKSTEVLKYIVK